MKNAFYLIPLVLSAAPAAGFGVKSLPVAAETGSSKAVRITAFLDELNRIPQEQLSETAGPGTAILDSLRDADGPDYDTLRMVAARAEVRKALSPAAKGFVAGVLSSRWDCFNLAGNLWLGALVSPNAEGRTRARQMLISFVQPAHISVLIEDLKISGPDLLAFEVLQEVTGQSLGPDPGLWAAWWRKAGSQADLAGRLLDETQKQLSAGQTAAFDPSFFWRLPDGLSKAGVPAANRSSEDQAAITRWNETAAGSAQKFVEAWDIARPLFERVIHQPDPRVSAYLQSLLADPMKGDFASLILAWRRDAASLPQVREAYRQSPTVGRAFGWASLGDSAALPVILNLAAAQKKPLSLAIMDDATRSYADKLRGVGVLPAEQAFEVLTHQRFGLVAAATPREKKKALRKAQRWLKHNLKRLVHDPKHGYYVIPDKT